MTSPESVFTVSVGCYSDRQTVAVFSTREKAQAVADSLGGSVDQFQLDPVKFDPFLGRKLWAVGMDPDGEVAYVRRDDVYGSDPDAEAWFNVNSDCSAKGYIWARDQDQAVKIAADKRRDGIASTPGLPGAIWTVIRRSSGAFHVTPEGVCPMSRPVGVVSALNPYLDGAEKDLIVALLLPGKSMRRDALAAAAPLFDAYERDA